MADRRDGRAQSDRWRGAQQQRDGRGRGWDRDRDRGRDRPYQQQPQQQQRWRADGDRDNRQQQWSYAGSKRAADSRGTDDSRDQAPTKQPRREQQQTEQRTRFEDERWRPREEEEEGELHDGPSHSQPPPQQQRQQPSIEPGQRRESNPHSNGDSGQPLLDEDEDVAAEREARELEERRKRRAAILTKHNSATSTSDAAVVDGHTTAITTTQPTPDNQHALPSHQLSSVLSAHSTSAEQPVAPSNAVSVPASGSEYDMFADSPSMLLPQPQSTSRAAAGIETAASGPTELLDSWDDAEGYYKYRVGDLLTDSSSRRQYRVCGLQGGGVFSTVLRVKPEGAVVGEEDELGELVVKVIRNNETMYKAGVKEVEFLTRIASTTATATSTATGSSTPSSSQPAPRRYIVQLLHHFQHRSHLCLVFPPYAMDLRKVIKKFGSVGLSLPAVRVYAMQLFTALRHLVRAGVVHGDIKPDNILVSERLSECALCDFGSASYLADCSITPYLVSRFYRAPEIMLGCEYGFGIDTWSVGCVLYELYTGRILFDGRDNNDMLHKIKQLRGDFPVRLIRRAAFAQRHFDADGRFCVERKDVNGSVYRQSVPAGAQRDLHADMRQFRGAEAKDEKGTRKLRRLTELILLCLTLDPLKRPGVDELIQHPFITEE